MPPQNGNPQGNLKLASTAPLKRDGGELEFAYRSMKAKRRCMNTASEVGNFSSTCKLVNAVESFITREIDISQLAQRVQTFEQACPQR